MKTVEWNDRFSIGVEVVDKAHQRLFSIVGKLISLNEDPDKQQHACREGIKYFKSYTLKHFAEEEAYMQSIQYEQYELHKSLHDDMRDKTLAALQEELEEQNYSVASVQHFLGICIGWLTSHIMIEDRAISGRTSQKWVHQPLEDVLVSLEKAAEQAIQSLYGLNASVVSRHYSGEDFSGGSVLCFRLTYSTTEDKRRQVFLIYEEQAVLRILSHMINKEIRRVDKTVVDTIRLLSQKFMDCMESHFNASGGAKLEKNDLLTFDQLLRSFDKEYPPYSLLFSLEGQGYLGFCVR
ncbi:MAG: hemerythrin family protein [Lachnospiraceae bacterium]|nr:hemerythrin family protein [Lachnospiraceae bacterium]MCI9149806.1 hemerythrin family protein [Lachnospiraceae bacterium]